jgi:hypothetical protein
LGLVPALRSVFDRRAEPRPEGLKRVAQWDMARVRVSIVFESGARIGPGKAKLLESIRDTGSIVAAARDMGMSYKRAWECGCGTCS